MAKSLTMTMVNPLLKREETDRPVDDKYVYIRSEKNGTVTRYRTDEQGRLGSFENAHNDAELVEGWDYWMAFSKEDIDPEKIPKSWWTTATAADEMRLLDVFGIKLEFPMDPDSAGSQDDEVRLYSEDEEYDITLNVSEDATRSPEGFSVLFFSGVIPGKRYHCEVHLNKNAEGEEEGSYEAFFGMPIAEEDLETLEDPKGGA
jgi:hypothetical protein